MKKHIIIVAFALMFFACAPHVQGQTVVGRMITPANTIQPAQQAAQIANPTAPIPSGSTTPPANDTAASATATKSTEDKKVEFLLKEKFDRTTSAVLSAWSTKPAAEEPKLEQKPKQFVAVTKMSLDGFAVFELEETTPFKPNEMVSINVDGKECGQWRLLTIDEKTLSAQFQKPTSEPYPGTNVDKSAPPDSTTDGDNGANDKPDNPGTEVETAESQSQAKASTKIEATELRKIVAGDKVAIFNPLPKKTRKPDEDAKLKSEVEQFSRAVAIGNWEVVKTELGKMKQENADKVYAHLLKSLATAPKKPGAQPPRGQAPPKPHLTPADILALTEAAPLPIQVETKNNEAEETKIGVAKTAAATPALPPGVQLPPGVSIDQLPPEALQALSNQPVAATAANTASTGAAAKLNHIAAIATLIRNSQSAGHDFAEFHKHVQTGTTHFGGEDSLKRLTAADLFMKCGFHQYVEEFLPKLENDTTKSDLPALKIWSQLAFASQAKDNLAEWLDKAWQINQWIISIEDVPKVDKDLALSNLIKLSSKIEKEVGVAWVNESFTNEPDRGMTILTNLGSKSADMANKAAQVPEQTRFDLLRLQNEAVEKLIAISPVKAKSWNQALTLLAKNWLKESAISLQYSTNSSGRDYMEMDMYGNYYWINNRQRRTNNRQPRPIRLTDVLEVAPSNQWQALVDESLHPNLRQTRAKLYMRINEEDKAFPYIEEMAESHPVIARDLVHDFLRIWTKNHDPNSSNRRRNPYIYFYGFDQKAEAIPLTRSKQERNLEELSNWVARIRKLPIEDVDEQLLANAFTTCHSSAEVFKLDRFRDVFGDFSELKPETIAALCDKMRANLASNWRDIRNQEQKQTKRREPEVQKAVIEGYNTAMALVSEALNATPDSWRLNLAKATLMFDSNSYSQTVQKSSEFSDRRDAAFEQFQLAAQKYADVVGTLDMKKQKTDVYDYWFYAALGAVDLGKVTDKTVPDLKQYPLIKNAIESLKPDLAEWHMAKFANNLFTRMSPIKPEIKFRYLRGGFAIVGDHPRAYEAKNLFDYYTDIVHEIKFAVEIDGSDKVGHNKPFGAYVNIVHTKEIERESGGFGKYVQNQNNMMYAYNYGRPTENYRDKFSDTVELALGEHFEILNVTFQSAEGMKSRPAPQLGWRVSPYAYVLLKAKGPEVDRIAPLKLDLDFLDTSGYVVIPVESPALVIDASEEKSAMRPVSDLNLTQTLDERQAGDGKLIVEINATAKGLVPDLDDIIDLEREGFELVSVDDQGVLPASFEKETDDIQILSDRSWTVEYRTKESTDAMTQFAFSEPTLDGTASKFQRYEDADLVEVESLVKLEKNYGKLSWNFLYWLIPLTFLGMVGLTGLIYIANQPAKVAEQRFSMPEDVNPFTVLTLLKDIRTRNGISNEQGIELQNSIDRIEQFYFGDDSENQPEDLEGVARKWLRNAK